jgi:hypothetical protein
MADIEQDAQGALMLSQRVFDAVSEGNYREALVMLREMDDASESLVASLVGLLRGEGATWAEIANALGVTPQAVHKRFS